MCYEFEWFFRKSELERAREGEEAKRVKSTQPLATPAQTKQTQETRKPETVEMEPEPV